MHMYMTVIHEHWKRGSAIENNDKEKEGKVG